MKTPIYDFVKKYAESAPVRGHMPGHKGKAPFPCGFESAYIYDITEIKGADALFEAEGIIAQSEMNAAKLFGAAETVYSCGGSTACIQAMLASVCKTGDNIIAARNVHRAFVNTCALLDLNVRWVYPEYADTIVSGNISAEIIGKALDEFPAKAVYITSPDYLGHISDIKGIAEMCHKHNALLLCDNAHGAYTAFLDGNIHPIALGADMCCDSAHKTLPVLTGGAYLHTGNTALKGLAKKNMSLFCSTSPSYLILQSLDMCNKYLAENFRDDLRRTAAAAEKLKKALSPPYELCGEEPLKLAVHSSACGLDGTELAEILRGKGIECEYADRSHIVLMLSPFNTEKDLDGIKDAFQSVRMPRIRKDDINIVFPAPEKGMSIRTAVFSESEYIPVENSVGRICGKTVTLCPPGIAAVVPGEIITKEAADIMTAMNITKINAVRQDKLI